jgi:ubiquitin-protein ligase
MQKIISEYSDLTNNPLSGVRVWLENKNFRLWWVEIRGPRNSPYFEGVFLIRIAFLENFPNEPPELFMRSYIYHPNVNDRGEICVNTLKEGWRPTSTMRIVLNSIKGIMKYPNPQNPWPSRKQMAQEYLTNYAEFCSKARYYSLNYSR